MLDLPTNIEAGVEAGTYVPTAYIPSVMEHFRTVIPRAHLTQTYLMWMQREQRMSVATRGKDPAYWFVQGQDMAQSVVEKEVHGDVHTVETDLLWSGSDATTNVRVALQAKAVRLHCETETVD